MKLSRTGSRWDRNQRININDNWDQIESENSRLSGIGKDAENTLKEALDINSEAKRVNDENENVQQQIDSLILANGESDAEVIQARGGLPLLKDRLDESDAQLAQNKNVIAAQADYVDMINSLISYSKMGFRKEANNEFSIFAYNDHVHASYNIMQDANDDLLKIAECFVGEVSPSVYDLGVVQKKGSGWASSGEPQYTTVVGDSFEAIVKGSEIRFRTYNDNRGGVWEVVIDNNPFLTYKVSTYSNTAFVDMVTLVSNLEPNKEHHVTATFLGDDPNNPPSGGTSRGWIFYPNSSASATILGFVDYNNPVRNLLMRNSNKEFAFSLTKNGNTAWIPDHGVGTAFNKSNPTILIDGVQTNVTDMPNGTHLECTSVKIIQKMRVILPNVSGDVGEFAITYHFDLRGVVNISGKWNTLQDVTINAGYPLMLPGDPGFLQEVVTSFGNSKVNAKDGSDYYFEEEKDDSYSAALVSNTNKNLIAAATVDYPLKTLRKGKTGKVLSTALRFWQRDTTPKLYFTNFDTSSLSPGDSFIWHGRLAVAQIDDIYDYVRE